MRFENLIARSCFAMLDSTNIDLSKFLSEMNELYQQNIDEFVGILTSAVVKERFNLAIPLLSKFELSINQYLEILNLSYFDSCIEITRFLIKKTNPSEAYLNNGLLWACNERQHESIRTYIEFGADINHENFLPLKRATEFDWLSTDLSTFRLLLDLGAQFTHSWCPVHETDFDYFHDNIFGRTTKGVRPDSLIQLISTIGLHDHNGICFDWKRFEPFMPNYAVEIFRSFELESVLTSSIQDITYYSEEKLQDSCSILSM